MLRRYILFLKKHPLITAAAAIAYAVVCIKSVPAETHFQIFVIRSLLCGAMAFFLYQISGDRTLAASYHSTWYVIRAAAGFWVFALLAGLFSLAAAAGEGYAVRDGIPLQLLILFLMFLFVGLFEEMAFRAVINDAVIYRFRDKKHVFVLSAVCCSVVFGAAHIVGAELSSPLAWGQAVGKTVSGGVFGLALLFLYWKTRNIWACGVVHGVYDFLVSLSRGIYDIPDPVRPSYVMPDEAAVPVIILYTVVTLIELLLLWFVWRKVGRTIDYREIRENW